MTQIHTYTQTLPAGNTRGGQHSSHLYLIYALNHKNHGETDAWHANKWREPPEHLVRSNKVEVDECNCFLAISFTLAERLELKCINLMYGLLLPLMQL